MKKPLRRRVIVAGIIILGAPAIHVFVLPPLFWRVKYGTWEAPPLPVPRYWGPPCSLLWLDASDPNGRGTCDGTCEDGTAPWCVALAGSRLQQGARVDGLCRCERNLDGGDTRYFERDGGPSP